VGGYYPKSVYLRMSNRANESVQVADDGLATNPNSSQLYSARSAAEAALGHFDQAISDAEQAIRLSPRDPQVAKRDANSPPTGLLEDTFFVAQLQGAGDEGDDEEAAWRSPRRQHGDDAHGAAAEHKHPAKIGRKVRPERRAQKDWNPIRQIARTLCP
jgi:hypothetical protein